MKRGRLDARYRWASVGLGAKGIRYSSGKPGVPMIIELAALAVPSAHGTDLAVRLAASSSDSPIPALPTFGCVGGGIRSSVVGIQALVAVLATYWAALIVIGIIWLLWWSFSETSWRGMSVPALRALSKLFGCLPVVLAILVMVYGIYTIFTKCGLT
jgi:hypothetical protein